MNAVAGLVLTVSMFLAQPAGGGVPAIQTFAVHGPTIIAFFVPSEGTNAEEDAALDDFQWYAMPTAKRMKAAGIAFHVVYARSFRVQIGNHIEVFRPGRRVCGYYFIAPGKKARIEVGVRTDDDLMQVVSETFGIAAK